MYSFLKAHATSLSFRKTQSQKTDIITGTQTSVFWQNKHCTTAHIVSHWCETRKSKKFSTTKKTNIARHFHSSLQTVYHTCLIFEHKAVIGFHSNFCMGEQSFKLLACRQAKVLEKTPKIFIYIFYIFDVHLASLDENKTNHSHSFWKTNIWSNTQIEEVQKPSLAHQTNPTSRPTLKTPMKTFIDPAQSKYRKLSSRVSDANCKRSNAIRNTEKFAKLSSAQQQAQTVVLSSPQEPTENLSEPQQNGKRLLTAACYSSKIPPDLATDSNRIAYRSLDPRSSTFKVEMTDNFTHSGDEALVFLRCFEDDGL